MPILNIPKSYYKLPERLTESEARLNRVRSELRRVELLERTRFKPVSGNKLHLNRLKEFETKFSGEIEARRGRVRLLQKADKSKVNSDRLKAAMLVLSNLTKHRQMLRQRAEWERRANMIAEAQAPNSRYGLSAIINPRSIFGTEAFTHIASNQRRHFKNAALSIPCVERLVRKEVMFAKRHAGKGWHSQRKWSGLSAIGC
jgi:hypothetical protein